MKAHQQQDHLNFCISICSSFLLHSSINSGTSPGEVPLKYNLAGKSVDTVVPMPDAQQTLTDASITVEDGTTILRFTKIMAEPDEIVISPTDNTMLWAYGSDSTLAFHAARDSFTINLSEGTTSSIPPVTPPQMMTVYHLIQIQIHLRMEPSHQHPGLFLVRMVYGQSQLTSRSMVRHHSNPLHWRAVVQYLRHRMPR